MNRSNPKKSQKVSPPKPAKRVEGQDPARTKSPYRPVSATLAISPSVSVLIPAINEAASLPHVFAALPAWVDEIVLVDGHSTDDTVALARRLRPGLKVVVQPGAGKGDALLAGFDACSGDIIVTIGGDGSASGREIIRFVMALVAGADFAKGSRFASGGGSDDMTIGRRFGNRLLSVLVNRMFRTQYTDLRYGCNAFWARHLGALAVGCAGSGAEALMCIRAARAGLRIQEIPSHEHPRLHGSSNLRAIRDGWQILRVILRERFRAASPYPAPVLNPGLEPTATGIAAAVGREPCDRGSGDRPGGRPGPVGADR